MKQLYTDKDNNTLAYLLNAGSLSYTWEHPKTAFLKSEHSAHSLISLSPGWETRISCCHWNIYDLDSRDIEICQPKI